MKNQIMLITYADSMGENLKELNEVLRQYFSEAVRAVHILPFYPSSADRGFAPMTYKEVAPEFGTYEDIDKIGEQFDMMFDFMVNHISAQSIYYQDFLQKKEASPYKDLFIRYKKFFDGGEPTDKQIDLIYKRKPRAPFVLANFTDGTTEKVWCTFDEEQIDLDITTPVTKQFIAGNLRFLASHHAKLIRLDAFAYAAKKANTSCFFVEPEIWDAIKECKEALEGTGVELLPEIHEHYSYQLKIAEQGYYVYDFALPMLVLYSLYFGKNNRLIHWLKICPHKQFTTLDTHDGIGIVDAADLMTPEEIQATSEYLYANGANIKRKYSSAEYKNLDIYQINCTYYSALGNSDDAYLLARAIQFFAPGIPQVYYVGLLAGSNDIELLEKTKVGRDINRHCYPKTEIAERVKLPVVGKLLKLMEFRNRCKAFDGEMIIDETVPEHELKITWTMDNESTTLSADLKQLTFVITWKDCKGTHNVLKL